ncbi:hypothetical protein B5V46_02185 [Rhodovulum sp. MB263]|nr:hypothetical protein B5V46_02185 [Rhodovulum sp. MB263]
MGRTARVTPLAHSPGGPGADAADLAMPERMPEVIGKDGPALILSGGCALHSSYNPGRERLRAALPGQ